jgi:hypothetical protein
MNWAENIISPDTSQKVIVVNHDHNDSNHIGIYSSFVFSLKEISGLFLKAGIVY